jgi:hypothetical protein
MRFEHSSGPGYSSGIYWQLNPSPIEFTRVREKSTPDYWPGIYRRLKLGARMVNAESCRSDASYLPAKNGKVENPDYCPSARLIAISAMSEEYPPVLSMLSAAKANPTATFPRFFMISSRKAFDFSLRPEVRSMQLFA